MKEKNDNIYLRLFLIFFFLFYCVLVIPLLGQYVIASPVIKFFDYILT